jgi:hypothetical protein
MENGSTSEANPLARTESSAESGVAKGGGVADPLERIEKGSVAHPLAIIERIVAPGAAAGEGMNGTESGAARNTNDAFNTEEPQSKEVDMINAPTDPTTASSSPQQMITN